MVAMDHVKAFLQLGGSMGPFECVLAYLLPLGYYLCSDAIALKELFLWNGFCQLCVFVPCVQLPLALTGKMAYVDIGWPLGLCVLGFNGLYYGTGMKLRRYLVCGCMMLHGGRMFLGALALFYPYTFRNGDLSRYQYAKLKWIVHKGLSERLWPIKAQLDTMTQCFANTLMLACPVLLAASNPEPSLHTLEIVGLVIWGVSWFFENMADGQKLLFLKECKMLAKNEISDEKKDKIKKAVLGLPPFNTSRYWLWTRCRHPNYFFEWLSWVGFAIVGVGSVATTSDWLEGGSGSSMKLLLSLTLLLMVRFFYDCLLYWTGSAPAEQQSVRKRPHYELYQKTTRVFFPFYVSTTLVDHHCTPRWPIRENLNEHATNMNKIDSRELDKKIKKKE